MDLAGLRHDGRRPGEMRELRVKLGVSRSHDGSAYLELGLTRVLAHVVGPHEPDSRTRGAGNASGLHGPAGGCYINVDFMHAPFAGVERRKRRANDRQSVELSLAVRSSLAGAIVTEAYPQMQIDVYIILIQDDGGRLPACLNAATMAVLDAGVSMKDVLVTCSAGLLMGVGANTAVPVVDMSHREQGAGGAYLPVAILPRTEEVVLAQMDSKLPLMALEPVLATAISGCHQVHSVLREALLHRCDFMLSARQLSFEEHMGENNEEGRDDSDGTTKVGAEVKATEVQTSTMLAAPQRQNPTRGGWLVDSESEDGGGSDEAEG